MLICLSLLNQYLIYLLVKVNLLRRCLNTNIIKNAKVNVYKTLPCYLNTLLSRG
jgi:hypothetical protein